MLDKVELRFGLSTAVAAFQEQIDGLLIPLIAKLDTKYPAVQKKILSILGHVNTRFKSTPSIKLPISKLIDLFLASNVAATKSFSLIYLEMAFKRLNDSPAEKSMESSDQNHGADNPRILIPKLMLNISKQQSNYQILIFAIFISQIQLFLFVPIKAPRSTKNLENSSPKDLEKSDNDPFSFSANPLDLIFILEYFIYIMLYSIPLASDVSPQGQEIPASHGLSSTIVNFITNSRKQTWTSSHKALTTLKWNICKFIACDELVSKKEATAQKYIINLIGSVDASSQVSDVAIGGLKRLEKPDFESSALVEKLFFIYLQVGPGFYLRLAIIDSLAKSKKAGNSASEMIRVVFDALFGAETKIKLRKSGVAFVQSIVSNSNDQVINTIAPVLITGLLKLINETGTAENQVIRAGAYEAVGIIVGRVHSMFEIDVLIKFFKAVTSETNELRQSIQSALTAMAPAVTPQLEKDGLIRNKLIELLIENIEKPEHNARLAAVKYATTIFPFADPIASYVCLLGAADLKPEVRDQSLKGLEFKGGKEIPFLEDLFEILDRMSERKTEFPKAPGSVWIGNFSNETLLYILLFIHQILVKTVAPNTELPRITVAATAKPQWPTTQLAKDLEKGLGFLAKNGNGATLNNILRWLEKPLQVKEATGKTQSIAAFYLYEIVALSPVEIAEQFIPKEEWLISLLVGGQNLETQQSVARILGIVFTANLDDTARQGYFKSLVENLVNLLNSNKRQERIGAILGIGYMLGKLAYRYGSFTIHLEEKACQSTMDAIVKIIEQSEVNDLLLVALLSFGEISRYSPFSKQFLGTDGFVMKSLDKIKKLIKSCGDSKIQEAAIAAVGQLAICSSPAIKQEIFDFIMKLANDLPKQPELHFNIAEALCCCVFGFESSHLDEFLDIPSVTLLLPTQPKDIAFMEVGLGAVLGLIVPSQSAVTKKAACIWLLCLVKFCKGSNLIQINLLKFHGAFSAMLADKDDFTQEIAAKGIGLIYEIGDENLKKELVHSLVSTFTEGKRIAAQSVSNDTQLFSGDIGSTPDGGNLNTYQSILSLAADMNQPDLVYKFMSLASHHQIWNSRRGASMGFGSIAVQAEKELEQYLPKLVPRLYRYQFDPHPKTAIGMKNIWRSLVKDPVKSINEFFSEIMQDLLKGMGDRQWRTRESCCAALSDLLHGRQLEQIQDFMTEIWNMCFRTLDDIKESVRKAAFQTCKTLVNLTVRYADPTYIHPSKSQKVMDNMIPFLLLKGLVNTAEEVRQFSLVTILKLCKTGGILLKPHVSVIVTTFLESLSSLEPQSMNYLSLNADKYNISQDVLDASRISAAKQSPVMDALHQCSAFVDGEILKDLAPKLCSIIRKGVGLPTRAGTARFLYTLVNRLPLELGEHADSLIKALSGAIFDRSAVIRKSFSTATGYVAKLATSDAIEKLAIHLKASYLEANDEESRSVAPITFLEISRHAPLKATDIHEIILPLAFVGSRDSTYPVLADIWTKVWEENTGGSVSAIKKWKSEIQDSLISILSTVQSWELKKQVGKAFVDYIKALGKDVDIVIPVILPHILDSLVGRTWDGKETLLEALSALCIEGKLYFIGNSFEKTRVEDVLIREAKKNNKPYKRMAIDYLGKSFSALETIRFSEVFEYLCEMADDSDQMEEDEDDLRQKPMMLVIKANSFKSLGLCFPLSRDEQSKYADLVGKFLGQHLEAQVWNVRLAILEGMRFYFEKLKVEIEPATISTITLGLMPCLQDAKYRAVREAAGTTLKAALACIKLENLGEENVQKLGKIQIAERDPALQAFLQSLLYKNS